MNSLAEWMLGTTDTDDVIQDVFVRAWEKLATFRGEAPFGAWLRRLAVNVLLRYREKSRTHEELSRLIIWGWTRGRGSL